jgi:hypothetical protein
VKFQSSLLANLTYIVRKIAKNYAKNIQAGSTVFQACPELLTVKNREMVEKGHKILRFLSSFNLTYNFKSVSKIVAAV